MSFSVLWSVYGNVIHFVTPTRYCPLYIVYRLSAIFCYSPKKGTALIWYNSLPSTSTADLWTAVVEVDVTSSKESSLTTG